MKVYRYNIDVPSACHNDTLQLHTEKQLYSNSDFMFSSFHLYIRKDI